MSHVAVQRVIVRMLYDAAFAERVYDDPGSALAGVDLTDAETAWLTASDPRAWRVDPLRRARTLKALLDEFSVSGALVMRGGDGTRQLDRFLSSPAFHDAIQSRRSLPLTFGPWLVSLGVARVSATAALELAIAQARRPRPAPPTGHIGLASGVAIVAVPDGTLTLLAHCSGRLRATDARDPVAAAVAGTTELDPLPPLTDGARELLLVEPSASGPAIAAVSEELHGLLAAADPPAAAEALYAVARQHGAERGEDRELVDEFIADGLLVRG